MLVLILTVCSLASPADCSEARLQIADPDVSPMSCMMAAPPMLAAWGDAHPSMTVARWRCGYPAREGQGT